MPKTIRFYYNSVFLPEYLSTIMISVPVSAFFMTTPIGGARRALVGNHHLPIALAAYGALALWLLGVTIYHRLMYHVVIVRSNEDGETTLQFGTYTIELSLIDGLDEEFTRFFGRSSRSIAVLDARGWRARIYEAVFGYDQLKDLLEQLTDNPVQPSREHEADAGMPIQKAWEERHEIFPVPDGLGDILGRLTWRAVCLIPVVVFDVVINALIILSLSGLRQQELMVYSAPLSLVASSLVARFVYYYLFTSTAMNRPLGDKVGSRIEY